jgi:hypothetical protein
VLGTTSGVDEGDTGDAVGAAAVDVGVESVHETRSRLKPRKEASIFFMGRNPLRRVSLRLNVIDKFAG